MNQEQIIRFALTLQDNAPTTINKYICKLSESVVFDSEKDSMTAIEITTAIKETYGLEFDVFEVKTALEHKNSNFVTSAGEKYQLTLICI